MLWENTWQGCIPYSNNFKIRTFKKKKLLYYREAFFMFDL